ncbi:hypothetical protein L798_04436 [Zootermopsis nevadensis]|uniref:Uncharacterized protein n=1 Tax=Zootermopsis nevadensis TaxID=136037 RepID=A0A067QFH3_ZOONE|nr:hypothetical protein L798_04436 [Zootermopsis nevadensis]
MMQSYFTWVQQMSFKILKPQMEGTRCTWLVAEVRKDSEENEQIRITKRTGKCLSWLVPTSLCCHVWLPV